MGFSFLFTALLAGSFLVHTQSDAEKERIAHHFNESRVTLVAKDEGPEFVHLWGITQADADMFKLRKGAGKTAELNIHGIATENMGGRNVLGYLEGSDPELKDEFIVYSAHYDHFGVGKPNA